MVDRTINADEFAASLQDILGGIATATDDALYDSIHDGCEVSRDRWKEWSPLTDESRGKYVKSIRFRVKRVHDGADGVVYSTMPGLPHLLEFGHEKIGGGKTRANAHVAPAAKDGFEATVESLDRRLDSAL